MNEPTKPSTPYDAELKEIETLLDECEPRITLGACILGQPPIAQIVQDALLYFETQRYFLWSWCIMPNHVHIIVTPTSHSLSAIEQSWKSFTSHEIGKFRGSRGTVWERESFDHAIRSDRSLAWLVEYVQTNPVVAGLCGTPRDWPFSSQGVGFQPSEHLRLIDPRTLPYEHIRSRGELPHLQKPGATYFVTFRLADAVICNRNVRARDNECAGETPAPQ